MKQLPYIILLLLSFATTQIQAQGIGQPSTSKKANKLFEEALKAYQMQDQDKAHELATKAIEKDPNFVDALFLAAEINSYRKNYKASIPQYERITFLIPDYGVTYYFLAEDAFKNGDYEKSLAALRKFVNARENKPSMIMKARNMMKSCEFSIWAKQHPVPFKPVNPGPGVNSPRDEYAPSVTLDGSKLIFTRLLIDGPDSLNMTNMRLLPYEMQLKISRTMQEDFYVSSKTKTGWGPAVNMGPPVNTLDNEGQPFFTSDGSVLYFTSCNRPGGKGSCDLYYTFLDGDRWAKPVNLGDSINSPAWESQPSISFDGKTIYFSSNRDGGYGNMDIWQSTFANGKWSQPKNLGIYVNSPGKEQNPCIFKDDQTLYFNSDGHPGLGGSDLYMSRRMPNGEWGPAVNLGYPINTPEDELTLSVDGDGENGYYVSDKIGDGKGGLDIYYFPLHDSIKPQKVSYVKATVFDAENKRRMYARIELIDLTTGKTIVESHSNKKTGEFIVCLPMNRNYALNVSSEGYLFHSENFALKEKPSKDPYLLDVPMKPIRSGQSVVLKNVFFDTDKFDLKPESKSELDKLLAFLRSNPQIKIELSGHTDNQGDKQKNVILSNNRAKAVMEYLSNNGIGKDRMTAKGYGDSVPIASNDDETGRSQNRRTEFKIVQ